MFVRQCGEEVGVCWQVQPEGSMGLEPQQPVGGSVVVAGGQEVGVSGWLVVQVGEGGSTEGEWRVDVDGLVLAPVD